MTQQAASTRLKPMTTADDKTNGRTHEPNLRELTAQLDDLKELQGLMDKAVRELMQERDRRYEDRFKAQETAIGSALAAQKELTTSAFASSEKAIAKAEAAQNSYNQTHNDLNRKMDDQNKATMPRTEAESRFGTHDAKIQELKEAGNTARLELMKEIGNLRESRSEGAGEKGGRLSQQQVFMMILSAIVALLFIGGVLIAVAGAIRKG